MEEEGPFGEALAGPQVERLWVGQEVDVLLLEQS